MVHPYRACGGLRRQPDCEGSGSGMLLNLVIGMVGGVLGGWLFRLMGIASTNMLGSLLTSVFGAIVLLLIVGLFTRRKRE